MLVAGGGDVLHGPAVAVGLAAEGHRGGVGGRALGGAGGFDRNEAGHLGGDALTVAAAAGEDGGAALAVFAPVEDRRAVGVLMGRLLRLDDQDIAHQHIVVRLFGLLRGQGQSKGAVRQSHIGKGGVAGLAHAQDLAGLGGHHGVPLGQGDGGGPVGVVLGPGIVVAHIHLIFTGGEAVEPIGHGLALGVGGHTAEGVVGTVAELGMGLHFGGGVGVAPAGGIRVGLVRGGVEDGVRVGVHQGLAQGGEAVGTGVYEVDHVLRHHRQVEGEGVAVIQHGGDLVGAYGVQIHFGQIPGHIHGGGLTAGDGHIQPLRQHRLLAQEGVAGDLVRVRFRLEGVHILDLAEVVPQRHILPRQVGLLGSLQGLLVQGAGIQADGAEVTPGGTAGVGTAADAQVQIRRLDLAHIGPLAGQLPVQVHPEGAAVGAVIHRRHPEPLSHQLFGHGEVGVFLVRRRRRPGAAVVDEEIQVAAGHPEGGAAVALAHDHVVMVAGGGVHVGPDHCLHGKAVGTADHGVHGLQRPGVIHQEVAAHVSVLLELAVHGDGVVLFRQIHVKAVGAKVLHDRVVVGLFAHLPGDGQLAVQIRQRFLAQLGLHGLGQAVVGRDQLLRFGELVGVGDHQGVDALFQLSQRGVLGHHLGGAEGGGQIVQIRAFHGVGDQGVGVGIDLGGGQSILPQHIRAAAGVAGALRAVVDGKIRFILTAQLIRMIGVGQILRGKVEGLGFHLLLRRHSQRVVGLAGDGEPLHPPEGAGVGALEVGEEQLIHGGAVAAHPGEALPVPHGLHFAPAQPGHVLIPFRQHHGGADPQVTAAVGGGIGAVHGDVQRHRPGAVDLIDDGLGQAGHIGEGLGHGDGGPAVLRCALQDLRSHRIVAGVHPGPVEVAVVVVHRRPPEGGSRALGQQGLPIVGIAADQAGGLADGEGHAVAAGNFIGFLVLGDGHRALRGGEHRLLHVRRDLELLMGHLVTGLGPQGVGLEPDGDVQMVLRPGRRYFGHGLSVGDLKDGGILGRAVGGDGAFSDHVAVLQELPVQVILIQVGEAVLVLHLDQAADQVRLGGGEPQALVLILHFLQLRLGGPVRGHQAVLAEVAGVVPPVAHVAAVAEELAVHDVAVDLGIEIGVVLDVVIIGAALLLLDRVHGHPGQDTRVVLGDGRRGGILGLQLFPGKGHVVHPAHGDLADQLPAAVVALIAQAEQGAGGVDGGGAGLAAQQLAVQVDLHGAVVIGGGQLMPVVQPVVPQLLPVHHQGVPAAAVDEEFQIAVAVELQGELPVALGGEHLVVLVPGGLADHLHGEGLAFAGEGGVVSPVGILQAHIAVDQAAPGQGPFAGIGVYALKAQHAAGELGQLIHLGVGHDPGLIHPVPNEAAQHIVAAADRVPVLLDVAHGVAHGVVVLAQHIGHIVPGHGPDVADGGVHIAAHVGAVALIGAFAVDRPGGVVVLVIPDQVIEHIVRVAGIARVIVLVAGGPADDGGHVLQTVEGGHGTVHGQLLEGLLLGLVVHELMGLQVGLGHHVQAVLVAQIVQIVVVGVVRGPHGVDVVALHQLHVFLHHFPADVLAGDRVGVVAVHAPEHQGLAVDGDGGVLVVGGDRVAVGVHFRPGEADLPEAQLLGHGPKIGPVPLIQADHQIVKVGMLGAPQRHILDILVDVHGLAAAGLDLGDLHGHTVDEHLPVLGVDPQVQHIAGGILGGLVLHGDGDIQIRVFIVFVQVRGQEIVIDVDLGRAVDVHVPEDAAVFDHILQFEPGAVAELVDLHRQQVLAIDQVVGDVEAVGGVGILAVAHGMAVEVDIICRLYALEVDVDPAVLGLQAGQALIQGEALAVQAHRVVVHRGQGGAGAGGIVLLPGDLGVGVDRVVQAPGGPAGRELEAGGPVLIDLEVHLVEIRVALLGDGVVLHHPQRPVGLVRAGEELDVRGRVLVEVDGAVKGAVHIVVDHAGGGEHTGRFPADGKDVLVIDAVGVLAGPFLAGKGRRGDRLLLLQHGDACLIVPGIGVAGLGVALLQSDGMGRGHPHDHAQRQQGG